MVPSAPSSGPLAIHVWYRRVDTINRFQWSISIIRLWLLVLPVPHSPCRVLEGGGALSGDNFSTIFPGDFRPHQDPGVSHFYGVSSCPLIGRMRMRVASDWPSFCFDNLTATSQPSRLLSLLKSPLTSLVIAIRLSHLTWHKSPSKSHQNIIDHTQHIKDSDSESLTLVKSVTFVLSFMTHRLTFPRMSFWCLGRSLTKGGDDGRTLWGIKPSIITIIVTDNCLLKAEFTCEADDDKVQCCNIFTF